MNNGEDGRNNLDQAKPDRGCWAPESGRPKNIYRKVEDIGLPSQLLRNSQGRGDQQRKPPSRNELPQASPSISVTQFDSAHLRVDFFLSKELRKKS